MFVKFQSAGSMWNQTLSGSHRTKAIPFQSAGSMRNQTTAVGADDETRENFNPLAPCGARQVNLDNYLERLSISIHWLHTEPDCNRAGVILAVDLSIH